MIRKASAARQPHCLVGTSFPDNPDVTGTSPDRNKVRAEVHDVTDGCRDRHGKGPEL